jgi:hypothetical protein
MHITEEKLPQAGNYYGTLCVKEDIWVHGASSIKC